MKVYRNSDTKNLENRPLVSKLISEHILECFDQVIFKPKKILQSQHKEYIFAFNFTNGFFTRKYYPGIIADNNLETQCYNLQGTFISHPSDFSMVSGEYMVFLDIISPLVKCDISNRDYAIITTAMLHKFLFRKYKRIMITDFNLVIKSINWSYINALPNPALFNEQAYIQDEYIKSEYFRKFSK